MSRLYRRSDMDKTAEFLDQLKESLGENYIDMNKIEGLDTTELTKPAPRNSELHLMLDLETMGKAPGGAIISIGAVLFNIVRGQMNKLSDFHMGVDLSDAVANGMKLDPDTIDWWMDPDQAEARRQLAYGTKVTLQEALGSFSCWLGGYNQSNNLQVWGNGVDFDNVILNTAFNLCGIKAPWGFRQNRCFRTLKNVYFYVPQPAFIGTKHCALDDASHQAVWLFDILTVMNLQQRLLKEYQDNGL